MRLFKHPTVAENVTWCVVEAGLEAGDLLERSPVAVGILPPAALCWLFPNIRNTCSGEIGLFLLLLGVVLPPTPPPPPPKLEFEPKYVPETKIITTSNYFNTINQLDLVRNYVKYYARIFFLHPWNIEELLTTPSFKVIHEDLVTQSNQIQKK